VRSELGPDMVYEPIFRDPALQRSLETRGFVTVPVLTAEAACAAARVLAVYGARDAADDARSPRQDYHVSALHPDRTYRRNADALVRALVAERVCALLDGYRYAFGSFIMKRPGDGPLGVHQDWTLSVDPQRTTLNCWVPLVDVSEESGALGVVAGSHRVARENIHAVGVPPYFHGYGSALQHPSQLLPLRAGHAVIFDMRLLHWSQANTTGALRPALGAVFAPASGRLGLHFADPASDGRRFLLSEARDADVPDLTYAAFGPRDAVRMTGSAENRNQAMDRAGFEKITAGVR
jgi:Phytanoyl-CoA dioxygenase (PhyH)